LNHRGGKKKKKGKTTLPTGESGDFPNNVGFGKGKKKEREANEVSILNGVTKRKSFVL